MILRRRPHSATQQEVPASPREAAEIGAVLARSRDTFGVSQQQVADELGVSVDEVAALERGTGPADRRAIQEAVRRYRQALKRAQKSGRAAPEAGQS